MGVAAIVTVDDLLRAALEARVDRQHAVWLEEAIADVRRSPQAIARRFPGWSAAWSAARRSTGAATSAISHAWTIDDAARTLLLVALGGKAEAHLQDLYRFGDAAERRGILRALPYLPIGDRGLGVVEDAIRSNDTRLIAAALGPYATAHLPDAAYDQVLVKCVFVGVPITASTAFPAASRATALGCSRRDVLERVAAGRDVPSEVWSVIDLFSPTAEIEAIERELASPFEDRRAAAERALSHRR